ncbi:transposase [Streptomyces sp. NBC_01775]|uniref:IS701 family transposase n=1 Tax=Streptomyces sp. NBC_01775 TaxID=2975939 RepID=UPI002DD88C4E|nr:transposase [Streptomyces sp. NBC_01775]WSB79308.1 transposase [Streptomyces sp. NBC_01775]
MPVHSTTHGPALTGIQPVSSFAEGLFGHLPRADQRGWAETYLRALLTTPGKKSVRRLAAAVSASPTACQSLQQFVNASPWDWEPVRRELTRWAEARHPVHAWTIAPAVLPKRGEHSVGVHHRFVPGAGRTLNCQLGVGLFLSGPGVHTPVDWRLFLPGPWCDDPALRRRTRVPESAGHRPLWADALDMVTAMASRTSLDPAPVVADMSELPDVGPLIAGLERQGRDFVIAVRDAMSVIAGSHLAARHSPEPATALSVRDFLSSNRTRHPHTAVVTGPDGQPRPTWIVSGLARLPGARPGSGSGSGEPHHTYRLFAERPVSGCRPSQVWITNMPHRRMDELLALTRLHTGTRAVRRSLEVDFGLRDFEGRSFPGWHHHMTLVSAAYAYSRLARPTALAERLAAVPAQRSA